MKQIFWTLSFILISHLTYGQDTHLTQINLSPILINPASTGMFEGFERVMLNHKNQWVNQGTKFYTSTFSADVNLLKPKRSNVAYLGLGLILSNDVGGDSKFRTKQFSTLLSVIVPVSKNGRFSLGIQGGMGQKSADLRDITFSNQFDGNEINVDWNNFEKNGITSKAYGDLSIGLIFQHKVINQYLTQNDNIEFTIGAGFHHINKPIINYGFSVEENLFRKWAIHSKFKKDWKNSDFGIESYYNFYLQGEHMENIIATYFRIRINEGARITGLRKKTVFSFGMSYRYKDAIAPLVKLEHGDWNFGLSYDVTISKLGYFKRVGGLELSIIYTNSSFALIKRN